MMRSLRVAWVVGAMVVFAGCGKGSSTTPDGDVTDIDADVDGDGALPVTKTIYASTPTALYVVDFSGATFTKVADFTGNNDELIADIAVKADGSMVAVSGASALYTVDPGTGVCTLVGGFGPVLLNSLTYLAADDANHPGKLLGLDVDGSAYLLDEATGTPTLLGSLGGDIASGDVVSVTGLGTFATITHGNSDDSLDAIDTSTGAATPVGTLTNHSKVFGLAYHNGKLLGLDNSGSIFTIATANAAVAPLNFTGGADLMFYGGGEAP